MDTFILDRYSIMVTAIIIAIIAVASAELPCLPDKQSFLGKDSKHMGESYFAAEFKAGKFAIERDDGSRMVKDFDSDNAKRYDIDGDKCTYKAIPSIRDIPQCVPGNAKTEGDAWTFKNIEGATLYYSKKNPSAILKKLSPDGKIAVTFYSWKDTVDKSGDFDIPSNCSPAITEFQPKLSPTET